MRLLTLILLLPLIATASEYESCIHRDPNGRVHRDAKAVREFRKQKPCPATGSTKGACPGYVIDHIIPLKKCGADAPSNMQWQTREEARAKDKWE